LLYLIGCVDSRNSLPKDIVTATSIYVFKNKRERRTPLVGKLRAKISFKKPLSLIWLPPASDMVALGNPVSFIVVLLAAAVVVNVANRWDRRVVPQYIVQIIQIIFYYFVDLHG